GAAAPVPGDGPDGGRELAAGAAPAAAAAGLAAGLRRGPEQAGPQGLHGLLRGPAVQRAVRAGGPERGGARLRRGGAGLARRPGGGAAPAAQPAAPAPGPVALRGARRRPRPAAGAFGQDGPEAAGDRRDAGGEAARGPVRRPGGGEPMSVTPIVAVQPAKA